MFSTFKFLISFECNQHLQEYYYEKKKYHNYSQVTKYEYSQRLLHQVSCYRVFVQNNISCRNYLEK